MASYPTIDVLLQGFPLSTDQGSPAFCSVVLVEGADAGGQTRRILVDAAHVGRRAILWDALARRGLGPADVDVLVLTHAHWDHMQNADVFEHARILLHPRERRYLRRPHRNDWATPKWTGTILEQLHVEEVAEGAELLPGVGIVDIPGHTAGSSGVTVATEQGLAVIGGDAVHSAPATQARQIPLVFWSAAQARQSIERVLALADVVYPGHDQPFRLAASGEPEYVEPYRLTVTGLALGDPGLELVPRGPRPVWIMPGIEEQAL